MWLAYYWYTTDGGLYVLQFFMLTHGYKGTEKCQKCDFRQSSLIKVKSSSTQGQVLFRPGKNSTHLGHFKHSSCIFFPSQLKYLGVCVEAKHRWPGLNRLCSQVRWLPVGTFGLKWRNKTISCCSPTNVTSEFHKFLTLFYI